MKPTGTIYDVVVGAKVSFIPAAFFDFKSEENFGKRNRKHRVTGIITYINPEHRFFRVAYEVNKYKLGQSFKY